MRRSTWSASVALLIESSCLAALIVVPVFFDPHSARTFDPDKILLLRSIAVVILVGLPVWIIEEGRRAYMIAGHPVWRIPVVLPMLLLTAAWGLSTMLSIAPGVSFWGSYFRCQGLYTWFAYATIFAAMVLVVRRREQIDRFIPVILLASVPPAIYGLIQHFGSDPIAWQLSP